MLSSQPIKRKANSKHFAVMALALTAAIAFAPQARGLDKESKEALENTQRLLRNKGERDAAIQKNQDAQRNDAELNKLMGQGNTEGVYGLSAEIFAKLVEDAKGDPVVLQQMVDAAAKDPEKFLKSLSPDQQAKIKSMANQVEKRNPSGKP